MLELIAKDPQVPILKHGWASISLDDERGLGVLRDRDEAPGGVGDQVHLQVHPGQGRPHRVGHVEVVGYVYRQVQGFLDVRRQGPGRSAHCHGPDRGDPVAV